MEEIRPGLKRWAVPHPDWKPEETNWTSRIATLQASCSKKTTRSF